jgi:hypothetical protein
MSHHKAPLALALVLAAGLSAWAGSGFGYGPAQGTATGGTSTTARQESVTTEAIALGVDTVMADALNNTPVSAASVKLFYGGLLLRQGAGGDYTVSGTAITWLAGTGTAGPQAAGEVLIAVYES